MRPGPSLRLASAGIAVVGVSFGMARYGYGLLLPDIRAAYGLSSGELGLIGAGSYVVYLVATAAAAVIAKAGARFVVLLGGVSATAGMLLAGLSSSPLLLVAGLLIGGASAGLVFPPFSDVVARRVDPQRRGRVMSAISSGTGWGVAIAAPVAILVGTQWRTAWLVFAAVAVLATAWAYRVLPADAIDGGELPALRPSGSCARGRDRCSSAPCWSGSGARPTGHSPSISWRARGRCQRPSRGFLAVVGLASILATATGELIRALGAGRAYALLASIEAGGIALLALAPGSLTAAFASAVMFGATYSAAVGVQAIWSSQLFSARPSLGLSATMAANGTGLMLGPVAAGAAGPATGLLAGAAVVLASALFRPRHDILA